MECWMGRDNFDCNMGKLATALEFIPVLAFLCYFPLLSFLQAPITPEKYQVLPCFSSWQGWRHHVNRAGQPPHSVWMTVVLQLQSNRCHNYTFFSFEALRVWPLNMYLLNPCLEMLPLRYFLTSLVPPISALVRADLLCSSLNIFPTTVCIYTQHLWFSYTNTYIHSINWRGYISQQISIFCSILCTVKLKLFHTKYEIMSLILINKNSKSHSTVCIFF